MSLNVILSAALLLLVSGCATNNKIIDKTINVDFYQAPLPEWNLGDKLTYGNGRSERVIKSQSKKVDWKKTKTIKFSTTHNFVEPQLHYESKTKIIDKEVIDFGNSDHPDELWPLKVGNSINVFYNNIYTNLKISDFPKKTMKNQICSVDDVAAIKVFAGEFDTYVVNCQKISSSGKKGTKYTYYYAPTLGHWVYKATKTKKKTYEKELMNLTRGVRWLSKNERKSLKNSLQNVMENNKTGQQNTWKSIDGKTVVKSYPTNTMKLKTGVFCRNYIQVIETDKVSRSAGLLCRNNKKWTTPKREKVSKLGFKGFF